MTTINTDGVKAFLPRNIADGLVKSVQDTSTVAQLSQAEPQRFGTTDYIVFNERPRAEFVAEGAEKGSTSGRFGTVTARPYKAQVTLRFTNEVLWADEEYQLSVLTELANEGAVALSRALDLGIYHRINPLTGQQITGWTNYIGASEYAAELGGAEADQVIRSAAGLLIDRDAPVDVNGLALDRRLTYELANLQTKNADGSPSGVQRYPSLGLGTDITSFIGIPTAQGNTVSGQPEAADTGVRGVIGDFQGGIRWGIQKDLPLELIQFGDPDGQGDLKRKNEIALRLEIVYGWYVFADRFALIKAAA